MTDFTEISSKYEMNSVVQKSASETLFDLLNIQANDDVLDLGCGTGHISKLIREKTKGKVVAIDSSDGMIGKAQERFSNQGISFYVCSAEQLDYQNEFDIIFCNSAFQWFVNPAKVIKQCYNSLRINGKMAIQSPAKYEYCPNFLKAVNKVKNNKNTQKIFSCFNSPWFFRDTAEEYTELFENAGFKVKKSSIVKIATRHTAGEVCKIFKSGAAAGYLNQSYYSTPLSQEYIENFNNIIRKAFENQADETGQVQLIFYRIYLLAVKNKR